MNMVSCHKYYNMNETEINCSIRDIPEYDYSHWNVEDLNFDHSKFLFEDFFNNYMIKNLPCLIKNVASDWECTKKWVENGEINYDYISKTYGDLDAPVADCNIIQYNSHCKIDMKVSDYMNYLKGPKENNAILYLKDWHLKRYRPNDNFYEIPPFFALDWLNEVAIDNKEDDFMFVYIGPKDSWTPLHEDVYCSYSWSVNIIGRKKWIFFPPGEENKLKDSYGNLPLTFQPDKYENIKYFEIIQEKGDAIFVPSGWHHQVVNELNTISINHNWINACNINLVWQGLQNCLLMVEHQIEEFKSTPEYPTECQLMLKSLFGMDFSTFITFLCYIAKKRISQLQGKSRIGLTKYSLSINTIKFDLKHLLKVMDSIHKHPVYLNKKILVFIEDEFIEIKNAIAHILVENN